MARNLVRSARLSASVPSSRSISLPRLANISPIAASSSAKPRLQVNSFQIQQQQQRFYAASSGLSQAEIQNRISEVLKSFEKVDAAKLSPTASFTGDLGLDSLDAVEVVMAIEEEFSIEIPDAEADNITTVQQAIEYVSKSPDGE
ncbi:acyl carrier protein [Ceraceosorus guamensis]|uniref:Acyl carrier protein n=1 Tax=Ceraceosorus guamensis TaxID=1522189 RepID=A0A316W971_9BASI|nr:acyl carrier protein [Ceraceosorus guamensis]PWN45608.1 acyl carrier protein [Ceraceosorus guamensis]